MAGAFCSLAPIIPPRREHPSGFFHSRQELKTDHRQNRVDTGRPNGLFGSQPCPYHVLFGHDDDVDRLTVPSRQRLRQFPEKNDATATRALLHHRRVKTIISLSHNNPLVCVRHTVCLYSSPDLSAGQCFPPKCAHKGPARCRIAQDSCAHRPFKVECAQQKPIPRCLWQVLRAHFGERHRREMQPTKACFLPRHRPSTYPVCVAAQHPHFWPGTPSRHIRNKGMVSVVAEKEFRIPNPKCTFPINAGRTGRRLSHGKAIVRFIRFVLLSICFKRQRWSIPPNWRTATPRWRKRRSHGCAP